MFFKGVMWMVDSRLLHVSLMDFEHLAPTSLAHHETSRPLVQSRRSYVYPFPISGALVVCVIRLTYILFWKHVGELHVKVLGEKG